MMSTPHIALYLLIFACAFLVMQLVIGAGRNSARKIKRANIRMRLLARKEGQAQVLKDLRKSRGLDGEGKMARGFQWLTKLVVQSGLRVGLYGVYLFMTGSAFVVSVATFLFTHSFVLFAVGFLGGFAVPILVLMFIAGRRRAKAVRQLPEALEVIVRSLKAGHPVPVAIDLVAREMDDPIGSEFGLSNDEITYGTSLGKAMQRMSDRVGHGDFDMFAATVRLQERTGGNLAELLRTNASMMRARQKMRLKIKAASSEGRMSALILNVVPFLLFAAVHVLSPDFYGDVKDVPLVRNGLIAVGFWMLIGNLVIRKMINFRI